MHGVCVIWTEINADLLLVVSLDEIRIKIHKSSFIKCRQNVGGNFAVLRRVTKPSYEITTDFCHTYENMEW